MSRHLEQLTASIRRGVQDVLARGVQDPRVSGLITVTGVRIAQDLTRAVVSVSVYPEERQHLTLKGLQAAAAYVRKEVGEHLRTRQMPPIVFELDASLKKQAEVLKALSRVEQERAARGEGSGAPGDLPSQGEPAGGAGAEDGGQ